MICPFCKHGMKTEVYNHPGKTATMQYYCDNPDCPVQPISVEGIPSVATADAEAIGYYESDWKTKKKTADQENK